MTDPDPEDMERLASRIAMLVSDAGEADNAGRAVGALARKLGLSGGDLKQIFRVGVAGGARSAPAPSSGDGALAQENAELRARVAASETAARAAHRERDALWIENRTLRGALERGRTSELVTRVLGGLILLASAGGTALFLFGPSFRPPPPGERPVALDMSVAREAHVRVTGALVHEAPDRAAPVFSRLPAKATITVRRLVWNALLQWGEVEIDGRRGFVVTTELDLL